MEAVRNGYAEIGIDNYYKLHSDDYRNPHIITIQNLLNYAKDNWDLGNNLLDLCCGSGEVTEMFLDYNIEGIDPYTYKLYKKNTGKKCYNLSFKDIIRNGLDHNYDTIISSFALHLCDISMLPMLLYRLGEKANKLIIITPHKRPDCNNIYGWKLKESKKENKVTINLYIKH